MIEVLRWISLVAMWLCLVVQWFGIVLNHRTRKRLLREMELAIRLQKICIAFLDAEIEARLQEEVADEGDNDDNS